MSGSNLEFHIVGWAACKVIGSKWKGGKNTEVNIQKAYLYDGMLTPNRDLSETEGIITGAYTTPTLVE